jgi:hypothetical protein
MKGGVHDFNTDESNSMQDSRSFPNSGLSAGVESGLSSVERNKRGALQAQQETHGAVFRQDSVDESAGSDNGKSFKFRY